MFKARYLSPMIPSFNIPETVSFLRDTLGFTIHADFTDYVILIMDNLTVHVLHAGKNIGEMEFYLEVDDLNAAWEGIKDKLGDIVHKAPFVRDYGMKEIHLIIPATKTLLFIGQVIDQRQPV
jgi:hypothetical protein